MVCSRYPRSPLTLRLYLGYTEAMRVAFARFFPYVYAACIVVLAAAPLVWAYAQEAFDTTEPERPPAAIESSASFAVTPVVSNEKAKARDIIKKELLLENKSAERIGLRAKVENVDPGGGAVSFVSPGEADLAHSLANWVEITRGVVELEPGESRKVPYLIHVNVVAEPGTYYARIAFTDGSPEYETDKRPDGTSLLLTVEVADDARERLQLAGFVASRSLVFGADAAFTYRLENVGNRDLEPRGTIRIFNRRGEEVGSVPLNADGVSLSPASKQQLATAWNASGRFGKYKAFLDLEYGTEQLASVQDTVYFWVFPWKEILASMFGVLVLAVVGTYVIHMRTMARPAHVYAPVYPEAQSRMSPKSVLMPSGARSHGDFADQPVASAAPVRATAQAAPARVVAQPMPAAPPAVVLARKEAASPGPVVSLAPRSRGGSHVDAQAHTVQLKPRR